MTDAFAGILSEARKYRLNLTVAHQYTAQLVSDKSTAVRDAVFGNVGTMIVFRVGADDADFLEKEFDPEFTPQDLVNLPNYKAYLKLMIDGVTSRPFSAKTLPPMVKSGNKEVEEEVIKSSRALYCRPKAVVEREINDWSGMSLGDDNAHSSSTLEKFPAICSMCKKETTVPFKPEPGRPVYCKECIAKIKSGEVKVEKGSENQIKYDESKFFKPLADLGIEFEQKDKGGHNGEDRHPERGFTHTAAHSAPKPGILGAIKKVFNKTPAPVEIPKKPKENLALKEVLNKITVEPAPVVVTPPAPVPEPVSLDTLKDKIKETNKDFSHAKDRSASSEEMHKLKDLIIEKIEKSEDKKVPEPPLTPGNIKEVPEDVLRKILEQ